MHDEAGLVDELPPAEHALLWAMRVWVIGHCRQQDVSARIDAAWAEQGVTQARDYLDGLMGALSRGARRPIAMLCLCRRDVSADERCLLDAIVFLQHDEPGQAHALLGTLMSDQAAAIALRSADALAQRIAGRRFPAHEVANAARTLH